MTPNKTVIITGGNAGLGKNKDKEERFRCQRQFLSPEQAVV